MSARSAVVSIDIGVDFAAIREVVVTIRKIPLAFEHAFKLTIVIRAVCAHVGWRDAGVCTRATVIGVFCLRFAAVLDVEPAATPAASGAANPVETAKQLLAAGLSTQEVATASGLPETVVAALANMTAPF